MSHFNVMLVISWKWQIKIESAAESSLMWEIERISLIKKKCYEYDQEWRMIRPAMFEQERNRLNE